MGIVDLIVLVILIAFAIIGFRRGVLKSLVSFVGFIIVIYLAYLCKNYLGDIFVRDLPFFDFKIGESVSVVVNVIMYQTLAFIIMVVAFGLLYKILIIISGIFEKIFKATIILGIPSKILGLIVGVLEGYIIVYLVLFFIAQPYVKVDILSESNYAKTILTKTPILSSYANNALEVVNEISDMVKNDETKDFDLKLTDLVLKHKVTSPSIMRELVDKKKIVVNGINTIIDKYDNNETGDDKTND